MANVLNKSAAAVSAVSGTVFVGSAIGYILSSSEETKAKFRKAMFSSFVGVIAGNAANSGIEAFCKEGKDTNE